MPVNGRPGWKGSPVAKEKEMQSREHRVDVLAHEPGRPPGQVETPLNGEDGLYQLLNAWHVSEGWNP
jgi:hypothetical protein